MQTPNVRTTVKFNAPVRTAVSATAIRLANHPLISAIGNGRAELLVAPDFLTPEGRHRLIDLISLRRRTSTVADDNGDTSFRISETCDMDDRISVVSDVRASIAGLLGLPLTHAEPLQGQRYGPGGRFKRHGDYFRPGSADFDIHCQNAGQRTWTVMGYLDEPEEGGHTIFSDLGVDVSPRAGMLLMWNNLHPDGTPNSATMHEATPVVRGHKNVITQWFRQRSWI